MVVETTDEQSEDHIRALYGLATTWNLRRPDQNTDLAEKYYNQLLALSPDHDLAAWSMLALVRIRHLVPVGQDPDYDEIRAAYRKMIRKFPGHLASDEAFIYLQSTYIKDMTPVNAQQALDALEEFVAERPDSHFISAAYSLMATCCEIIGQPSKRLEMELQAFKTAEVDPTNPFQDNAWRYWMLATLAEFNVGDFETARTYYQRLITEYPTDIKVYPCEQALERMDRIENEIRAELEGGS